MTRTYTPYNWIIVKLTPHDAAYEAHYRVLGSWSSGYLDVAAWKISSGIVDYQVDPTDPDLFELSQHSGSVYAVHVVRERVSSMIRTILSQMQESTVTTIEHVPFNQFLQEFERP